MFHGRNRANRLTTNNTPIDAPQEHEPDRHTSHHLSTRVYWTFDIVRANATPIRRINAAFGIERRASHVWSGVSPASQGPTP